MDTDIFLKNPIKTCRICLEEDSDEYISPCLCKGTQKHIHIECLKKWRDTNLDNIDKRNSCEICNFKFIFKNRHLIDHSIYLIDRGKYLLLKHLLLLFISFIIITIEYSDDFFIIRTLNMYNNSSLLKLLRTGYYFWYVLFYFPFTYFIFEIAYMIYFNIQYREIIRNSIYIENIKYNRIIYNSQVFIFLFYYYFFFMINITKLYMFSNFFITLYNIIVRQYFFKMHNSIINKIIIQTNLDNVILSFEDKPLLCYNIETKSNQASDPRSDIRGDMLSNIMSDM